MKINVFLTNVVSNALKFSDIHKKILEENLPEVEVTVCNNVTSFKENLGNTDIALVWYFSSNWFKKAPNLKWIAIPAAGTDYMDINVPENIKFTNSSFHGEIIAETVLGVMLGFSRKLFWISTHQDEFHWPKKQYDNMVTTLKGTHLVILGYGHIGTHIAKVAKPFGVKITGVKRTLIDKPDFFEKSDKIITVDDLDSILPEVDHLVIVLPRNKSTDNIINAKRLSLLPETAYLYNVGRGNAVDEEALINALNQNELNGAYLDVFQNEPLDKNSPLRKCPNILMTPHSSAIAPNMLNLFLEEFIQKYKEWTTQ